MIKVAQFVGADNTDYNIIKESPLDVVSWFCASKLIHAIKKNEAIKRITYTLCSYPLDHTNIYELWQSYHTINQE